MNIVLDAMGGDYAPAVTVEGAVLAAREFDVPIILVGRETVIRQELAKHETSGLPLSVVQADEIIEMEDKPSEVVRGKPNSCMHIGMRLVKTGEADAFVTAGNTGATLAIALSPTDALAARPGRHVILVDTYELLAPLDSWLRDVFLPQLPERVLVVLASRNPPAPAWRADPGWQPFLRSLPLRNLSPEEGRDYLIQRDVPT